MLIIYIKAFFILEIDNFFFHPQKILPKRRLKT